MTESAAVTTVTSPPSLAAQEETTAEVKETAPTAVRSDNNDTNEEEDEPCVTTTSNAISLTELLAENAALRARLQKSLSQRILEDVVEREVHEFLTQQHAQAPVWCASITHDNTTTSNTSMDNRDVVAGQAMSAALAAMATAKANAEDALRVMQEQTVQPLQAEVERLCHEKQTLRDRVTALEEELRFVSSDTASDAAVMGRSAVGVELHWLRQSEAALKTQLDALQGTGNDLTSQLTAMLHRGVDASARVPQYEEEVATLRAALMRANITQRVLEVQLAEREMREAFTCELAAQHEADLVALHELHRVEWAGTLREARVREDELRRESATLKEQLNALQSAEQARLAALAQQQQQQQQKEKELLHDDSEEGDENAQAAKRRRLERAVLDQVDSLRGQCIRFRVEGGETIARLERELSALRSKEDECRLLQSRLKRSERSAHALTTQLAQLAAEVHTLQTKLQQQRSQCSGLEAERDALREAATAALRPAMSETELRACAETLREAARSAATRRAEACVDPETIAQMTRQVRELRSETGQLALRRERLQRYVALCESRVAALLQHEVLLRLPQTQNSMRNQDNEEDVPDTATNTSVSSVRPFVCLTEVLEYLKQCVQDIYYIAATSPGNDKEREAATPSMSKEAHTDTVDNNITNTTSMSSADAEEHVEDNNTTTTTTSTTNTSIQATSGLALRARLGEVEAHLRASQQSLKDIMHSWQESQEALRDLRTQHESLSAAHTESTEAASALQASLTQRLNATLSELAALKKDYSAVVDFAGQLTQVLHAVAALLTQEREQSRALRQLVAEERQAMTALLQRNAEMWDDDDSNTEGEGNNGEGAAKKARVGVVVKEVVEAIGRLRQYMQDTVDRLALRGEEEKTRYIHQLSQAVRGQEVRLAELQEKFTSATAAQANALAQQLLDAQAAWEQKWQEECHVMEEAQRRQSAQQAEVYMRLQEQLGHLCSDVYVTQRPTTTTTTTTDNKEEDEDDEEERVVSVEETLRAIRSFIAAAKARIRQRPQVNIVPPPVAAPPTPATVVTSVALPSAPLTVQTAEPQQLQQAAAVEKEDEQQAATIEEVKEEKHKPHDSPVEHVDEEETEQEQPNEEEGETSHNEKEEGEETQPTPPPVATAEEVQQQQQQDEAVDEQS